jgi:hypothetical protein
MADYTAKLHSGILRGLPPIHLVCKDRRAFRPMARHLEPVGYTQMSLSDLSSVWKWKQQQFISGGVLTTHTEESPADAVYMNLVLGDTDPHCEQPA